MASKNLPFVSVVVRTHNRSDLLNNALKCLISQTYRPIEIIVVDHNSTDNTKEVASSFGEIVRYYKHTGSFRDTFNIWRDKVKGEFISLLDDDDFIKPDCIEKLVNKILKKKDVDIVFARHRFFSVNKDRCIILGDTMHLNEMEIRKNLLRTNIIPWNSVLFRAHCLSKVPKIDNTITGAFDWFFWIYMVVAGFKFYQIDEILGFIQRSSDSVQFEIERMSVGILECKRYYGRHLTLYEKLLFGYNYMYGTQLINYGLYLLENGGIKKGRLYLLKGICRLLFSIKGRKKYFIAILIWVSSLISEPQKSRRRIEKLFKNYYFRNYFEIETIKKV
jgi:glycosyltransferase involved in cell wall biosynthesis